MDIIEQAQRERIVKVAQTYIGTPYHHNGKIKGAGVDCLTFLALVYEEAGLVSHVDIPKYDQQWHLHNGAEKYLEGLLGYVHPVPKPNPADIVLFRMGRTYSHAAIVIEWPQIIHAWHKTGVVLDDAVNNHALSYIGEQAADHGKPRPKKFFSYWN